MARGIDAVLTKLPSGVYDAQIGPDGDFVTADSFDTAIIVSLFSDQRADEATVPLPERRRGWVGDETTPDFQIGSTIWTFSQSRLTRSTLNGISDAMRAALEWFVADGLAAAIVEASAVSTVTGINLEVRIERTNSRVEKRHFDLWTRTGIS